MKIIFLIDSTFSSRDYERFGIDSFLANNMSIELSPTNDILKSIENQDVIKVGFAAETDNLIDNAKNKIKNKNLNLIVANDVTLPGSGFGSDQNQVSIIDKNLNVQTIELASKYDVSNKILDALHQLLT